MRDPHAMASATTLWSWTTLAAAAAVTLIGAGLYEVTSLARRHGPEHVRVASPAPIQDVYASLERLTHATHPEHALSATNPDRVLPDVETMAEKLAARLEASPNDIAGWRMLGWTYAQMNRFSDAAAAYARGLQVEPGSAELKALHDEAKARADTESSQVAATATGSGGVPRAVRSAQRTDVTHGSRAEITAMLERLADKLRQSPRNVDGWIQLIRSRVTLGEAASASHAFREALAVFTDDDPSKRAISDVAAELGLRAD